MENEILENLKESLASVSKVDSSQVTAQTEVKDLGLDSLGLFTLVGDLEEKYGKEMDENSFEAIKSVNDILSYFSEG